MNVTLRAGRVTPVLTVCKEGGARLRSRPSEIRTVPVFEPETVHPANWNQCRIRFSDSPVTCSCSFRKRPLTVANFATVPFPNLEVTRHVRSSELIAPPVIYLTSSVTCTFWQCQWSVHIGNVTCCGVCVKHTVKQFNNYGTIINISIALYVTN
jgi:hypothetical protein